MRKRRIVITGAAGNIGGKLRNGLKDKYDLVLLDKRSLDHHNFIHADLRDYDESWVKHFGKVSTVIHLAGNPNNNASWEELIPDNVDSVLNVCQACAEKGVERLIFASSCHTMGGYRDKSIHRITADMRPVPDCSYGISKLIGERICKSYSERYTLSTICLRIGWVPRRKKTPDVGSDFWLKSLWLSDRDLIQVFEKTIEVRHIKFKVLYAMSNNEGMIWDLQTTMETLNYTPQDGLN